MRTTSTAISCDNCAAAIDSDAGALLAPCTMLRVVRAHAWREYELCASCSELAVGALPGVAAECAASDAAAEQARSDAAERIAANEAARLESQRTDPAIEERRPKRRP